MTASAAATITRFRPEDPRGRAVLRRIVYGAAGDGIAVRAGDRREVELLASYAEREGYSADMLYGGFRRGNLVTGALAVESPGRMALVFIPPGRGMERHASTTIRALDVLRADAQTRDIALLQALVDPADRQQESVLAGAGYSQLATLLYCRRLVCVAPPSGVSITDLEFVTYAQAGDSVFLPAVAATYEGSLDCPGLSHLRAIEDVMAGHRATGEHDPSLWSVAKGKRDTVGVLLLSPVSGRSCFEVVYMGVAPEHRGRGVASTLLAHARQVCVANGIEELILAVDQANTPARALYDRWAFTNIAQRRAWILPLAERCGQ
ncbi:MAG: GNAT family N-acetyltransferase [Planctomycetes bacterium]|nr:GNAT family N-acetyltransferase [Planctomycetota bacterium]